MGDNMGMSNKQFQAFIRLIELVRKLIALAPKDKRAEAEAEFEATIQLIKEDN